MEAVARLPFRGLGPQVLLFAGLQVEAVYVTLLRFGEDDIRVLRVEDAG